MFSRLSGCGETESGQRIQDKDKDKDNKNTNKGTRPSGQPPNKRPRRTGEDDDVASLSGQPGHQDEDDDAGQQPDNKKRRPVSKGKGRGKGKEKEKDKPPVPPFPNGESSGAEELSPEDKIMVDGFKSLVQEFHEMIPKNKDGDENASVDIGQWVKDNDKRKLLYMSKMQSSVLENATSK